MSTRPLPPPPPGALLRAACLVVLALPLLALAHTGGDGAAHHAEAQRGLVAGLVHPLTGADHLLAMLALGLWSALALRRARDVLLAPLAFAATVLLGAVAARSGVVLPGWWPGVEPMIAASLLALGLMVATRVPLGAVGGAAVAALFALFHGAAHGQELAGAGALAGMVLATALLHAAGLALGVWLRARPLWAWATRGFGASVALAGLAMLAA